MNFTLRILVEGREIAAFPSTLEALQEEFTTLRAGVAQLRRMARRAVIAAEFPDGLVKILWSKR